MNVTTGELIVWLVVGALSGSLAGMLVTRRREGYGHVTNLVIGLVGAVIGGFMFSFFHLDLNLGKVTISYDQVVSAFTGSLVFIGLIGFVRHRP
jgi:uncharacterized membrane protein YeaQ/YmgE (transglycosylase-associated protein family)